MIVEQNIAVIRNCPTNPLTVALIESTSIKSVNLGFFGIHSLLHRLDINTSTNTLSSQQVYSCFQKNNYHMSNMTNYTMRYRREWTLWWFGVIGNRAWAHMDSDQIADPRSYRRAPMLIWHDPIGLLTGELGDETQE
jgi:hypothetical protein